MVYRIYLVANNSIFNCLTLYDPGGALKAPAPSDFLPSRI